MDLQFDDLYQAYLDCRVHKSNTPSHINFEEELLTNLYSLFDSINDRTYEPLPSNVFVTGNPPREIFAAQFRDRIVQHFIVNELGPIIDKHLIFDCCSCRRGKGTDFAIRRVYRNIQSCSENFSKPSYALKLDLSGFFMRINRQRVLDKFNFYLDTDYTGKYYDVLKFLLEKTILNDPTQDCIYTCEKSRWNNLPDRKSLFKAEPGHGLAIGNLTSQLSANLDLNEVDHYVKHNLHVKYYTRYVDDIIIIGETREELEVIRDKVIEKLESLGYNVNRTKTYIILASHGVRFLGKTIYYHIVYPASHKVNDYKYRFANYKDEFKSVRSAMSQYGTFKNYKGGRLFFNLFHLMTPGLQLRVTWDHFKLRKLPDFLHKQEILNINMSNIKGHSNA